MIKTTQDGHDIYLFGNWDSAAKRKSKAPTADEIRKHDILMSVIKTGKLPFRVPPADGISVLRDEVIAQSRYRSRLDSSLRKVRDQLWGLGQNTRVESPVACDMGSSFAAGAAEGKHIGIMLGAQTISDVLDGLALQLDDAAC